MVNIEKPNMDCLLTSIFLIMTEFPFVYKKFFPLGSPPNTKGWPLCVRGNVEKIYSGTHTKNKVNIKSYL